MKRLKPSGFPLLLALAYMLIEGSFDPLWILLFSLLHELGHLLMLRLQGIPWRRFRSGLQGFSLEIGGLSYRAEFWVSAAGPAASLLLALGFGAAAAFFSSEMLWFFTFANAALALLNLLPILPLDGGRMLRAVLAQHLALRRVQAVGRGIGLCILLPLLAAAFWQFLSSGYNLSLLLVCIYLIVLLLGDEWGERF